MTCCVCYENVPECVLVCSHTFCHACIIRWCEKSQANTCPCCRQIIKIKSSLPETSLTREVRVECHSKCDLTHVYHDLINFYIKKGILGKNYNLMFDDVHFLKTKDWVKTVIPCEYNLKGNVLYTRYTFINNKDNVNIRNITIPHNGLQRTTKTCHKKGLD